jgi:hypothetical protein
LGLYLFLTTFQNIDFAMLGFGRERMFFNLEQAVAKYQEIFLTAKSAVRSVER